MVRSKGIISHRKGLTCEQEYGKERAIAIKEKSRESHKEQVAWNKGLKDCNKGTKAGFQKGHPKFNNYSFPKGHKPWNTGMKGFIAGKNHWNWTGGLSKIDKLIRQIPEYKLWREKIFQRDDYTCKYCDTRGCYIEAHHLKQFKILLMLYGIKSLENARSCQELWDTNNGITLCLPCHNKTKLGRK